MCSGDLSESVDGMAQAEVGRDSLLNVIFIYNYAVGCSLGIMLPKLNYRNLHTETCQLSSSDFLSSSLDADASPRSW